MLGFCNERSQGSSAQREVKVCKRVKTKLAWVLQRQRGRALFATPGALAPQRSATKSPQSQGSSTRSVVKGETANNKGQTRRSAPTITRNNNTQPVGAGSALTYKHKRWRPHGRHLIANSVSPVWAGTPPQGFFDLVSQNFKHL